MIVRSLLLGGCVGVVAWLPIPNHYVLLPGPAVPTAGQVVVEGHPRPVDTGEYLIATVYRRPATTWWALRALIQHDWALISENQDRPQSLSVQPPDDHEILRRVVYRTCGLEPPLWITLLDLTEDSPLQGKVEAGDRLVEVAGVPLRQVRQVREIVQRSPAQQPVQLLLQRPDGQLYRVAVVPRPIQGLSQSRGLGVLLSGHEEISGLPKIHFPSGAYQGNSSDLMLGLDLCERLLKLDLRHSRRVSGSGGLSLDGSVTPVQGLHQKYSCALEAHADLFFVPWTDLAQLQGLPSGSGAPVVVAVHSLSEAIQWLQKPRP